MEQLRTVKKPQQAIPTFAQTVGLLMKVRPPSIRFCGLTANTTQPENLHVKFNVDVKVQNNPARLFSLMHDIIASYENWETRLAPRLLIGLWHPSFISACKENLPYCKRSYIGVDPALARKHFWDHVDAFSMWFGCLTTADGERFRKECKAAGKKLMVWTVNDPACMMEAVRWGVDAILTDVTKTWLELRSALQGASFVLPLLCRLTPSTVDYDKIACQHSRRFLWTTVFYYTPVQALTRMKSKAWLERVAGPFQISVVSPVQ